MLGWLWDLLSLDGVCYLRMAYNKGPSYWDGICYLRMGFVILGWLRISILLGRDLIS